jgi:predicted enzyme related to lactoylglutathione lyase
MGEPVVHWQIVSKDPAQLRDFYTAVFDWQTAQDEAAAYTHVHSKSEEGIPGGIGQSDDYSGVTFYVRVGSIDEYLGRIESLGGTVDLPATRAGDATIAIFADPQGNSIGLIEE